MENNSNREFNCKNEELPVICGFVASSLERDLASFETFSPVFNQAYIEGFKTKIALAE